MPSRKPAGKKGLRRRVGPRAGTRRARAPGPPIAIPEGWSLDPGGKSISIQLKTRDFVEAVDVIGEVRDVAESLQHHPDLHLERWNNLRITTYSHDVGKLTKRDARLAARVNDLLAKRGLLPRA